MKFLILTSLLFLASTAAQAADAPAAVAPSAPALSPAPNPETVDISDLEDDYWRPNKDELEVVQNRRFEKAGRFELGGHFGIMQGQDFENEKSFGASATYNFNNEWFVEASHHRFSSEDNDFVKSIGQRYGFRPDFNRENHQSALQVGWTPIYAKFSLLGNKISHFEMYLAAGAGITNTLANHFTAMVTVGQKFYLTEHLLFRIDWRISSYNDRINTPQGATSIDKGGPGYVEQRETTNNIIFGLGWMF
ncbi:MAG: outer membrane beta-barrel domain-containing protein [Proteobacteria bacterium]|nr:MAG: outer membrane beta-barrel domain-containing protein [Pseudomonadota bacterium]